MLVFKVKWILLSIEKIQIISTLKWRELNFKMLLHFIRLRGKLLLLKNKLLATAFNTVNLEASIFFGHRLKGWDEANLQNKMMK